MNYAQRRRMMKKGRLPSLQAVAAAVVQSPPNNRYKSDPLHRLRMIARSRVASAIRQHGYRKHGKTHQILGCSFEELKRHIEKQFTKGMKWSNYGDWHIDHRIPIASAKSAAELEYLLHYMNLQPMWAGENLAKSDSMPKSAQLHLYL